MLCLSAWSSQDLSKASQTFGIPCYTKLGGKCVGKLRLCTSTSAYQVLRDIQVQASKLLPHAWREFEDMMVWCDDRWLIPSGFAYRQGLTQEEEEQAWSKLRNAKRLEVMWDDNDEYAKAHVSENTFKVVGKVVQVHLDKVKEHRREVVGLLKRSRLTRVQFNGDDATNYTKDVSFLKSTTFTEMTLIDTLPPDWSGCVNIEELYICSFWFRLKIPLGIGCLRNLRRLTLDGVELLPQHIEGLNLATLSFGRSKQMELSNLVPLLVKMPNLEVLCYHDNLKQNTLIPTELGNLVSLKVLDLQRNRFVGSIPSELGQLRNLTSLTIREDADFDLTCPQEVLDLSIAIRVIERAQIA